MVQATKVAGVLQKEPAGHGVSNVVPSGQWLPLVHAIFCVVTAHTLPAGQLVWLIDPAGQKVPVEQAICDDVLLQYDPAWHSTAMVVLGGQ